MEKENLFVNSSTDEFNCFFNPNWENPMDQSDPFESALSSFVSSPVTSSTGVNGDPVVVRELIGRLGNICNSREISPSHYNNCSSNNVSCYSTPLNSPPKMSSILANSSQFVSDPGFVERAARFSCFGGGSSMVTGKGGNGTQESRAESSVSEQIPGGELSIKSKTNESNSRKRKAVARGKAKQIPAETNKTTEESNSKRSKSEEEKKKEEGKKAEEPPKDYIHVRARRGQATDSHSLAERVRREKISERMKYLQDLVPGCNKVIGKAVMLDEIINYVQSLQRQVEFLSMKLATVNPRMEALVSNYSKDIFQYRLPMIPNTIMEQLPYTCQPISNAPSNAFPISSPSPQVAALWEDDLQSVVQMGYGHNQPQTFHGNMKIEL